MSSIIEEYHPLLLWSQDMKHVYITVTLADTEDPRIRTGENFIQFRGKGLGANGLQTYSFELQLYKNIVDDTEFKVTAREVTIKLVKETSEVWPRVTESTDRFPWLRIDFNKLSDGILAQMGGEEEEEEEKEKVGIKVVQPSAEQRKERYERMLADNAQQQFDELLSMLRNPLILYLFVFNMFQWAGYIYVFGALMRSWYNDGEEGKIKAFDLVADRLLVVQLASLLEIAHTCLGWTKGGIPHTILQVFGRNLVFFLILIPHKELHEIPTVFYLFLVWSCIELVRYPYYALQLMGESIGLITYLRYTLWVPLYPIGFMCEGKLIILALPLLQQSRRFCLEMPNPWNISFDFPLFLQVYLLLMMPAFLMLMQRMYKQRRAKLSIRRRPAIVASKT